MATVLITGGAGFIGSNLAQHLVKKNHTVRVLDNFSTGRRSNLENIQNDIEIIEGDIRYYNNVIDAVRGCDYVFHKAALPSVYRSVRSPIESNDVNITGTLNVLLASKESDVKRVIYAASSSAYGDAKTLPKHEKMAPNAKSPYAINKLTGEMYCRVFNEIYGLETISLRYFNVFGPKQDPNSFYSAVIPKFIMRLNGDKVPIIYGDGETSRDFTYIDNVVRANELAMRTDKTNGEVINIGTGERYTLNQLHAELTEIMDKPSTPRYEEERVGDVKHSLADISLAKELIGYTPKVKFREGLERTVEWMVKE